MNQIPYEILELILTDPVLSAKDVVNFSCACSQFRNIINSSDVIWKQKFFQRWEKPRCKDISVDQWMKEYITRVNIEEKTMDLLTKMSQKFYTMKELSDSDLAYVNGFVNSNSNTYYYVVDYLIQISCLKIQTSMTVSYYANKLLKYVKKIHLNELWHKLQGLEEKFQTLEKGAIFVADWFQTNVDSVEEMVVEHLNYVADLVKKVVKERYKDHPLNNVSENKLLTWRYENIPGNMFELVRCKEIIYCINHVLSNELKYSITSASKAYRSIGIDSAITDRIATPLIWGIIYESVSRRLGVKCEIIYLPFYCLLSWKDNGNENTLYQCIDMNCKETFSDPKCCSRNARPFLSFSQSSIKIPNLQCFNMQEIAEKVARFRNISDVSVLELLLLFAPTSLELYSELGHRYMIKKMDITGLIEKMTVISLQIVTWQARSMYRSILSDFLDYMNSREETRPNIETVRKRTKNTKFAVGMIGRHKMYNYTCVIYGWDPLCKDFQNWMEVNGDAQIDENQPFYNVLADDGEEYYVPQESLHIIHSPPYIYHPEMGHYFEEYCTTYYKPNEQLQKQYPEDAAALQKLLQRHIKV